MDSPSRLFSIAKRRALPAAITLLAAMAVSCAHILFSKPVYRATTRLVVDDRAVSLSEIGQEISESQNSIPSGASLLATQAELIKSERVLERALETILPELRAQAPADSDELLLTVAELKEEITISVLPATNILQLSFVHSDPAVAAFVLNNVASAVVLEGADAIRSQAASVRQFLEEKIPVQQAKLRAIEADESQYRQQTGIVSLEVQTEDLVGRLTDVQTQELALISQLQAARVQDAMLQEVTGVETLERAYAAVRVGQNETIGQLEAQLVEIESLVAETESVLGSRHPDMVELLARREQLRNLYTQAVSRFIPAEAITRPSQTASEEVSQTLVSQYITERIALDALVETLATVQAERAQLESSLSLIPDQQRPLFELVRDREEAANTLSLLRNQLEEARIAEAQISDTVRVADSAQVPTEASGSPLVTLAIAAAAGLLLAVGVVLLLETIDDRLHTLEELEAAVDLPVFGLLPRGLPQDLNPNSITKLLQNNQWVESYRLLFKALAFHQERLASEMPRDMPKDNLFVFSGLQADDGHTLTAANLVAIAARLHRRSLVIDANWQKPLQHLFFDVSSGPGLTQTIEEVEAADAVDILRNVQSSRVSSLDVLAYGSNRGYVANGNVSEAPEMQWLLDAVSAQYDFAAVAAPAVDTCADAVALSGGGAGLILVVQAKVTSKALLMRSLKKLAQSGASVMGIVMAQTPDPAGVDYLLDAPDPDLFSLEKLSRSRLTLNVKR